MDAIQVKNLSVSYENNHIIENMNLTIPRGMMTVIIGANGSGKSTLLKTIAQIIKPKSGTILINGMDVKKQTGNQIAKQMAVLPQSPKAPFGLLVKELVSYGRFPYQKPIGGLERHDQDMINWAIKETGLEPFSNWPLDSLSGGQRQRAWIAMSLAQETDILLFDEPTTYLDMTYQLEILLLLQRLNRERNSTIVMVLHELNHACRFADHIIGVKAGKVVFEGNPNEVITTSSLKEIYGIRAKLTKSEDGTYPIVMDYHINA